MARIVIHQNKTKEEVEETRLRENFALSHEERVKKMFDLMRLGLLFKKDKGPFKKQINIKKGA